MLVTKRFFPSKLSIFAIELQEQEVVVVYFYSPEITFRVVLPTLCSIWLTIFTEQLSCYLRVLAKTSSKNVLITRTFLNTFLNRVYFCGYKGLKTIGVGYRFITSKNSRYIFISAGMSHLVAHRLHYNTTIHSVKKKKRLLTLNSSRQDLLLNESNFIRDLRPPDRYCGKGLRLFHELYLLKEGKKQIR